MLNRGELSCCSGTLLSGCVQWVGFCSGSRELREGQPKAALSWQEGEVTCVLSDGSELDIIFSKRQSSSLLHQILGGEIQIALLRASRCHAAQSERGVRAHTVRCTLDLLKHRCSRRNVTVRWSR